MLLLTAVDVIWPSVPLISAKIMVSYSFGSCVMYVVVTFHHALSCGSFVAVVGACSTIRLSCRFSVVSVAIIRLGSSLCTCIWCSCMLWFLSLMLNCFRIHSSQPRFLAIVALLLIVK